MQNVDFEHRLPLKQLKSGQGVFPDTQLTGTSQSEYRHAASQAQVRMFNDTQSHRQKSEWFTIRDPIGTSKLCEPLGFARTAWLESLAGVYASDGAGITNEHSAGVYAYRGAQGSFRSTPVHQDVPYMVCIDDWRVQGSRLFTPVHGMGMKFPGKTGSMTGRHEGKAGREA